MDSPTKTGIESTIQKTIGLVEAKEEGKNDRDDASDSDSAAWGFSPSLAALVETDRPPGRVGAYPAFNSVCTFTGVSDFRFPRGPGNPPGRVKTQ